jgi:transcriptional regulator with XRE-family HTH domain
MSEDYNLKQSIDKLGALVPVLRDVHGNIIDGFHRLKENENYPSVTVETVKNPVQLILARMAANVCRREVSAEEKTEWLKELTELTGWSPKEIAEETGMSERWVYKYLPSEQKKEEPEQLASARRALRECSRCFMASRDVQEYKGEMLCPQCVEEAKRKPMRATTPQETAVIPEPKIYKPKETWAHRKASMQVPVSHMEQRLAKRLVEAGIAFESQVEYCIAKCIPDFVINQIPFFIDGEDVHFRREEKDDSARSRLAQFYNVEPIGLTYKYDTKTEEDRLFREIMDKIS